ncbi:MAG TPA: hypothetical protein VL624_16300 [Caldimonas sp.]|nr:hypothetical protein [Caldimonas sp.]
MFRTPRMPGPFAALVLGALLLSGCTAPGLILTGMGIATDTSMTWDIVKHVHAQITADDPTPCAMLNSVQRALNARCPFEPGSIKTADLAKSGLQGCPLSVATSDMRVWRALPELIEKGAKSESCARAPLQDLAEADACPDFQSASPEVLKAIVHLAETDPRSVRHDVFRMFSCPRARAAGLDRVLVGWLDAGKLQPGTLSFSPLEAIDPQLLVSRFGRELQTAGHSPSAALDNYDGALPSGFEEALRTANWTALEWWFFELPQLANIAPPSRGGQMSWVPLQRVLLPGFLADSAAQPEMVSFLLAHGANPRQKLPFDTSRTVIGFAKAIKSPVLTLLDAPAPALPSAIPATALASNGEAAGGARPQRDGGSLRPVAARFDPPATGGESASR